MNMPKVYIIRKADGVGRKPMPLDKSRYEARKAIIDLNGYRLATDEELIKFGIKEAPKPKKETKTDNPEKTDK